MKPLPDAERIEAGEPSEKVAWMVAPVVGTPSNFCRADSTSIVAAPCFTVSIGFKTGSVLPGELKGLHGFRRRGA